MDTRIEVELKVNGRQYRRAVEPRYLLVDFLRHELGLTGTHIGCEHGVCGACTIQIDGRTARSCLHFAVALDGAEITTVEALDENGVLNHLQKAFRNNHALQCGFCTSGFLLSATELLYRNPNPSEGEVREAMTNNICRCTGYNTIVAAVLEASRTMLQRSSSSRTE